MKYILSPYFTSFWESHFPNLKPPATLHGFIDLILPWANRVLASHQFFKLQFEDSTYVYKEIANTIYVVRGTLDEFSRVFAKLSDEIKSTRIYIPDQKKKEIMALLFKFEIAVDDWIEIEKEEKIKEIVKKIAQKETIADEVPCSIDTSGILKFFKRVDN